MGGRGEAKGGGIAAPLDEEAAGVVAANVQPAAAVQPDTSGEGISTDGAPADGEEFLGGGATREEERVIGGGGGACESTSAAVQLAANTELAAKLSEQHSAFAKQAAVAADLQAKLAAVQLKHQEEAAGWEKEKVVQRASQHQNHSIPSQLKWGGKMVLFAAACVLLVLAIQESRSKPIVNEGESAHWLNAWITTYQLDQFNWQNAAVQLKREINESLHCRHTEKEGGLCLGLQKVKVRRCCT
jgi:hypothetical protein